MSYRDDILRGHYNNRGLTPKPLSKRVNYWSFQYDLIDSIDERCVSADECKVFSRINSTGSIDKDKEITCQLNSFIDAATLLFESLTGITLINKTYIAWLDDNPSSCVLQLSKGIIQSINSVKVYDEDDSESVIDSSNYHLNGQAARLHLKRTGGWATGSRPYQTFSVEFVAGYGENNADVPEMAKTAIKQIVSHWYEYREANLDLDIKNVPMSAKAIISTMKNPNEQL